VLYNIIFKTKFNNFANVAYIKPASVTQTYNN